MSKSPTFQVTHPLRIPDRWDCLVFFFLLSLPFCYSVLEYGEDISHLNLTLMTLYIYVYIQNKKKKRKKERKGRKKSQWHFHQPFHEWAHIFWSLGWRTGLCSYFSLGYSWDSHDPCIFPLWLSCLKACIFVLYYQIHVLSVEEWRKNIKLFRC